MRLARDVLSAAAPASSECTHRLLPNGLVGYESARVTNKVKAFGACAPANWGGASLKRDSLVRRLLRRARALQRGRELLEGLHQFNARKKGNLQRGKSDASNLVQTCVLFHSIRKMSYKSKPKNKHKMASHGLLLLCTQ